MKRWTIILLVLVGLLLAVGAGFVLWASDASQPTEAALAALQSDDVVTVEQGDWIVFTPAGDAPGAGFIFYPGGKVDPRAYARPARAIAAAGYRVVIVPMPLNLAVLAPGRAADVIAAYPEINAWGIGGHSLGGAMAAKFADDNPNAIQALILWASYPASGNDLSAADLAVNSIYGTLDGVAAPETVLAAAPLLPPDTPFTAIEGGNHAQFGDYGAQAGDNPAAIPAEAQQTMTVGATLDTLAHNR